MMTYRSCLLLFLLSFLIPLAVATDEEWRAFERTLDHHPEQVGKASRQELQQAEQRGDKVGQLKAIRKLTYSEPWHELDSPLPKQVDHSIVLADELRDDESLVWLYSVKAAMETWAGRPAEADALFQKATAIAERNRLTRLHAFLLYWKAASLDEARDSDRLAALTKAYSLFEAVQDKRGMVLALHSLALGHLHQGRSSDNSGPKRKELVEKSIDLLTRSLTLLDPGIYRDRARQTHWLLGKAYANLPDLSYAKDHLEKALDIATILSDHIAMGLLELDLGRILNLEKRHEEALARFDAALRLLPQEGSHLLHGVQSRAETLAYLGRKQEGLDALSQVQAQASRMEQLGYHRIVRTHYFKSAHTYTLLGEFGLAYRQIIAFLDREQRANAGNNRKVAEELTVKFDVQLKEAENALLRSQQKEAKVKRIALTLALALSLILLGAVGYNLNRRAIAARIDAAHHRALAAAEAAANEAKRTFLANMSHELRSPLNVVLGFTQLLMRKSALPEDARQDLAIVYNSGQHLYTLINQVLDLSKIEAGRLTLNQTDFDLYALMDELAEMFTIPANQKGLHLLIENDPHVPQYLHADALKLRQVLINLLNNAIKFTSEGSVALNISMDSGSESVLTFFVSDTGPGVAPDELDKLGGAFVQAQAGQASNEGTGLGLAISASFVELMGGSKLKLSTRLGEGTTIAFDLPVLVVKAAAAAPATSEPRVVGSAPGEPNYRILVADDQSESRQLLMRLLSPLGFEVREADNGEAALAVWNAWSPHLIWMDMRMPLMDGPEAARRIKETKKGKTTVIVALTASSFDEQREEAIADDCDDFLRKPFHEAEIFELMQKHLGLQFIYEGTEADTEPEPEPLSMADLSVELREQLWQAISELNVEAMETVIEQIRGLDDALANRLAQMAYLYEFDQMRQLVEKNATV